MKIKYQVDKITNERVCERIRENITLQIVCNIGYTPFDVLEGEMKKRKERRRLKLQYF